MRPLHTNILIQFEDKKKKTESGLFLVGETNHETRLAKVIAVGAEVKEVFVDDTVALDQDGSATRVELDGAECFMVREDDIVAVIEK